RSWTQTARLFFAAGLLVLLDGLLEDSDDQSIEGCLVLFGPARQLLVQHGWHANLEVHHSFRHGNISSVQRRNPHQEGSSRVSSPHTGILHGESGHALEFYLKLAVDFHHFL